MIKKKWAMILIGLAAASAPQAAQTELAKVKKPSAIKTTPQPICIEDPVKIQKIIDVQKANKKTENKYNGYREIFREETDANLIARLVYAETLAANCAPLNHEVLPGIAEVIGNRVRVRSGNVRSVVFQRDQFASSLNSYSKSRFRDFLCPKDMKLWESALRAGQNVLNSDPVLLPKNAFNYYLYMHEPSWPVIDWADRNKHQPVKTPNFDKIDKCVRFFNHLKFN